MATPEEKKRLPFTVQNASVGSANRAPLPVKEQAALAAPSLGRAVGDTLIGSGKQLAGSIYLPAAVGIDATRQTVAGALGSRLENPYAFTDAPAGLIQRGTAQVNAANTEAGMAVKPALNSAIGATPVVPAPAAPLPVAPAPVAARPAPVVAPAPTLPTTAAPPVNPVVAPPAAAQPKVFTDGLGPPLTGLTPTAQNQQALGNLVSRYERETTDLASRPTVAEVRNPNAVPGSYASTRTPAELALEIGLDDIGSGTRVGSLGYDPRNAPYQQRAARAANTLRQQFVENDFAGRTASREDAAEARRSRETNATIGESVARAGRLGAETRAAELSLSQQQRALELQDKIRNLPTDSPERAKLVEEFNLISGKDNYDFKIVGGGIDPNTGYARPQEVVRVSPRTGDAQRVGVDAATADTPPPGYKATAVPGEYVDAKGNVIRKKVN